MLHPLLDCWNSPRLQFALISPSKQLAFLLRGLRLRRSGEELPPSVYLDVAAIAASFNAVNAAFTVCGARPAFLRQNAPATSE